MTNGEVPKQRTIREMPNAPHKKMPRAIAENWAWQLQGACSGSNNEVFFHPEGERDPARTRRVVLAKTICEGCPVIQKCRSWALETEQSFGVWGGLSEDERIDILRTRRQRNGSSPA